MPNYTKTLEVTPEINMNSRALSDGKLYVVTGAEPVGEAGIELPLFINKKWLDHLKLEVPTTTEEYYQVLKGLSGAGRQRQWGPQRRNPPGYRRDVGRNDPDLAVQCLGHDGQ